MKNTKHLCFFEQHVMFMMYKIMICRFFYHMVITSEVLVSYCCNLESHLIFELDLELVFLCRRHQTLPAKALCFLGCWSAAFICPFIWTDLVTMISHERLELFRWNLQGVATIPYWWTEGEYHSWWHGTVVERRYLPANFPCPALDLQLMGDHLCR